MPSSVVGAVAFRNDALNCGPWVRSLTHTPEALTNSPGEIRAAWPTTVARSRCPRTLTRSTQKPVSALWKVTRSTNPDRTSAEGAATALSVPSMLSKGALRPIRWRPTPERAYGLWIVARGDPRARTVLRRMRPCGRC